MAGWLDRVIDRGDLDDALAAAHAPTFHDLLLDVLAPRWLDLVDLAAEPLRELLASRPATRWVLSTADDAQRVADTEAVRLRTEGLDVVSSAAKGAPGPALVDAAETLGASIIVVGNRRVQG